MNTPVNFEIAKLLKEKGFDLYCVWSYWNSELTSHTPGYALEDGTTSQENYWDFDRYYAPTIAEVVMWLYEQHGIWICVLYKLHSQEKLFAYDIRQANWIETCLWEHSSPTEAYEAAIDYTLKNLI
jgi:hypothetical protein